MSKEVEVTVKFEGKSTTLRFSSEPITWTVTDIVTNTFLEQGWNGGVPPEGWDFTVYDASDREMVGIDRDSCVMPGDTVTVTRELVRAWILVSAKNQGDGQILGQLEALQAVIKVWPTFPTHEYLLEARSEDLQKVRDLRTKIRRIKGVTAVLYLWELKTKPASQAQD